MKEHNLSLGSWMKSFLSSALAVGVLVGGLEALVIAGKVVATNALGFSLLVEIVLFVNLAILIFVSFMMAANLVFLPILVVPLRRMASKFPGFGPQRLAWQLNFFWAILFTLLYWVNFNSGRSIFTVKSILHNLLAVGGAVLLAETAARIAHTSKLNLSLIRQRKPRPVLICWIAALVLAFVLSSTSEARSRSGKPNVILLIIDTLRADRLGCYGYDRPTTPAIDAVAKESVLFEQAYVPWASSLPSHASIMTSMYPYYHGAFPNGKFLNPRLLTLPKILREYGYKNGAFVSNTLVGNQYNFQLGYDTFTDLTRFNYRDSSWQMWVRALNLVRLVDKLSQKDLFTELALAWIEKNQSGPFFLWGQWLYPHAPYEPPVEYLRRFEDRYAGIADGSLKQIFEVRKGRVQLSEADQQHYAALYDGEVALSDFQIQRIYHQLESLNLLENSIVIVTSDHGENLLEHGLEYGHAGVHESSVRIPLIIRLPGRSPQIRRVSQVVQSIDIAPTVLDLLGIPVPEQFQGKSLVPLMNGEPVDWPAEAYCVGFRKKRNFFGLRKGEWKLILDVRTQNHTWELYHLPSDPHETKNLYENEAEMAAEMKREMEAWLRREFEDLELVYHPGGFFAEEFDEKTMQRLRTLGYIK
ncbi:MAG: sulfatase-like hydrolase/transferase [bacterium]